MENLRKAMEANPDATPIIHSDRGSQSTSREYRMVTPQYQMTRSRSRVGNALTMRQLRVSLVILRRSVMT